ncbi:MAG: SPFH domain-containing protein [Verrucomicrobiota bacterium]
MTALILGGLLLFAGIAAFALRGFSPTPAAKGTAGGAGVLLALVGLGVLIFASAVNVAEDETGLVIKTLGSDLPAGQIIALKGEKGPQADVLGPGWHFGYWPWSYEVRKVDTVLVPEGQIGIVTALDGRTLSSGDVYAPAWKSADDMLNARKFLESADSRRGPQLTILTPGRYRLNPALFRVQMKPVTFVSAGEVGVVKANAGPTYEGADKTTVNGVDIVPPGHRGIWNKPLLPGAYNLHPDAFQVIKVRTTQRVYTYQHVAQTTLAPAQRGGTPLVQQGYDDSVRVRSKDGFTFPVEVRLSLSVTADNAAYMVALLGDPDRVVKDEQEGEEFEVLEARLILPTVRAALRNVAETLNALEFVATRSRVEATTTRLLSEQFKEHNIKFEGAFIGAINLDASDAGKQLLLTQTDREVALNQKQTYQQQEQTEQSRKQFIRAREEAEQQKQLVEAEFAVRTAAERARAQVESAKGEAETIRITSQARKESYELLAAAIGAQGVTLLESLKLVSEGKIKITPEVLVQGGEGDTSATDALAATLLRRSQLEAAKPAAK